MSALISRIASAIAIDPGYAHERSCGIYKGRKCSCDSGCACALQLDGQLIRVWFERARDFIPLDDVRSVIFVVVEQPQQDARSRDVPPAVLIKLAWEGAKLAGLYAGACGAELLDPTVTEWKATEKKPCQHARLWQVLSPAERRVLGGEATHSAILAACKKGALCRWKLKSDELYPSSFKTHNLLDAAALLMWASGRLEKVG